MTEFEVYEGSVQYSDDDGDVLELVSASDDGVLLNTGQDGAWVSSRDLPEVVRHMARLSDVDGEFIEASGHEVESLFAELACGVGASRAVVTLGSLQAKAEIVEESARNLWAIAQVMRDNEERESALPEVLSYVSVADGARTTYAVSVLLDRTGPVFVTKTEFNRVQVTGRTESGRRMVYSMNPKDVTVVRPKPKIGDRVTIEKGAKTFGGESAQFHGETVGTIIRIDGFDATVFGYSHEHKTLIEQQVALDFLTPAEMPKAGDRVHVHAEAKCSLGNPVDFGGSVTGIVIGMVLGTGVCVRAAHMNQFIDPKYVTVLTNEMKLEDARVKLLRGSVPFSVLPEAVQTLVDEHILKDMK